MLSDKILELEIQLLLKKYGYSKVVKALGLSQERTIEDIEQEISKVQDNKVKGKPARKKSSVLEIALKVATQAPHISQQLQLLAVKFEETTFLPLLKDVRRFLEKQSNKPVTLKNRLAGASQVFSVLKNMTAHELDELLEATNNTESDFSLLSEQIISRSSR